MTAVPGLLDTDVLSAIMRRHPKALARAQAYLTSHSRLSLSIITRYEILRGLHAKRAVAQIVAFDRFCSASQVLGLAEPIIVRAAMIYGDLHQQGALIGDADIPIAASAIENGFAVITSNEAHFARIPGLVVDNWLKD
jgi:tRNA(fMet)-specific endonuclease VapC